MWSNALCLGVAEPITWLAAYIKAHTLRNQLGKQAFFKKNEKTSVEKKSAKSWNSFHDEWLFSTWKLPAICHCEV